MEPFEIVVRADDDADVKALSGRSSADDMTRFLEALDPGQIAALAQDGAGLRALYERLQSVSAQPGIHYLARTRSGDLIGHVTVKGAGEPMPELQVEICPPYRGQGYGRTLLRRVIQEVFRNTAAAQIRYCTGPYNKASMELALSLGGVLQEPASPAERLLLRTFYIYPNA